MGLADGCKPLDLTDWFGRSVDPIASTLRPLSGQPPVLLVRDLLVTGQLLCFFPRQECLPVPMRHLEVSNSVSSDWIREQAGRYNGTPRRRKNPHGSLQAFIFFHQPHPPNDVDRMRSCRVERSASLEKHKSLYPAFSKASGRAYSPANRITTTDGSFPLIPCSS
jgi:hypothetical protein